MPQGFNNSELIRSPIRSIPQARQKAYDFPENKKDILEKSPGQAFLSEFKKVKYDNHLVKFT